LQADYRLLAWELSREYDRDQELLSNLRDESLSAEERIDHEKLAECVRTLMGHLSQRRDREVLERFYLREELRTTIQESLQLTELQFNQVLRRARQRFGPHRREFQRVIAQLL
jgi:DNA-directed RNA polymerase specialized sigma subunit